MQKWEYKKIVDCSEETLNKLGAEGWELVGTLSVGNCYLIFKRPKQ